LLKAYNFINFKILSGVVMLRASLTFIVIILLAGCTLSTPIPPKPPVVFEATAISQSTTEISQSTEEPLPELTAKKSFSPTEYILQEYPVESRSHPHDVAPAPDGTVWYNQGNGSFKTSPSL
jgi:hypothetical protein